MKKIMILVLSLAVLFGFAACDNSTPDEPSVGQVTTIYATTIPQYLTGETVDLADFGLVGEDNQGNVVDIPVEDIVVVNSAELVADSTAGRKVLDLTNVTYKGMKITDLVYDAFELDAKSLKVSGPSTSEDYYVGSDDKDFDFKSDNYTVTVTYNNGTSKTLSYGEYTVDFATVVDSVGNNKALTFTTAVGGTAQTDNSTVKINVVADPVVGIEAKLIDEDAVIYSRAAANDKAVTGDYTELVNVYKKLQSGYVETTPLTKSAALVFTTPEGLFVKNAAEDDDIYGSAGTYAVTVAYTEGQTTYPTVSVDIKITADEIKSIAAEVRSGSTTATGVAAGATINKADIKVTATYESGVTEELASTAFELDPPVIPEGASGTYNVKAVLVDDSTMVSPAVAITIAK